MQEPKQKLLKVADETNLKIIIILLPPSESGNYGAYSDANYDWKGWVVYFKISRKYILLHSLVL